MSYRIAGIDVHKKMLAVVVSDVDVEVNTRLSGESSNGNPEQLRSLAVWLLEQEAEEAVKESTAQYWKQCGRRWSGIGSHSVRSEKARDASLELCT